MERMEIKKRDHLYIGRRNRAECKPLKDDCGQNSLHLETLRCVIVESLFIFLLHTRAAFRTLAGAINILLFADVSAVVKSAYLGGVSLP
jgi:hypothetical protein